MEKFIDILTIITVLVTILAFIVSYKNLTDRRRKSLDEFNDLRKKRKNEEN